MIVTTTRCLAGLASLAILSLCACASDAGHNGNDVDYTKTVKSADAGVVQKWRSDDVPYVVVDVRTEKEHREEGRVPGSVLYPYSYNGKKKGVNEAFLANISRDFEPGDRLVILCSHGMRATQAAADLGEKAGFTNVYVFPGGVEGHHMDNYPAGDGWLDAGLPYEK
jgi:rhodanese-related sulfurtransferase